MTKRKPDRTKTPRIVVTPEMIEVGVRTLEHWGKATKSDQAAAVYRAMSMAAPPNRDGCGVADPTMLAALQLLGHRPPRE
jgi:hypothetical protein